MVQTGIPFGEVSAVRDWLKIDGEIGRPAEEHASRPVLGFACRRSEVSGRRLWGWASSTFGTAERFFAGWFVANYCPLAFFAEDGRNITPDRLPAADRSALFPICDDALRRMVAHLRPTIVIGVGRFARERARSALTGMGVQVGGVTHPSPANPAANRGWEELINVELGELGFAP
jgi:single-strand selective monofunctional uracil DNA glycosylase